MESRVPAARYEAIADDLLASDGMLAGVAESNVRICYLSSDLEKKSKGRLVYGECEKVPAKFQWAIPYDFTITVYEPNVERFGEEQFRILLLHELMHVGIETDGNEERYSIVPHDIEDFREIADRYGVDWYEQQA